MDGLPCDLGIVQFIWTGGHPLNELLNDHGIRVYGLPYVEGYCDGSFNASLSAIVDHSEIVVLAEGAIIFHDEQRCQEGRAEAEN